MHLKHLPGLLLAAAFALLPASCAPVDDPTPKQATPIQSPAVETPAAVEPLPPPVGPATPERSRLLKQRVEAAIEQVRQRDLLLTNGFWTVFHGILGLGPSATLKDPELGTRVNALDYIFNGGEVRGLRFIPTEYGVDVETGEMFVSQGHQDQFLAEIAQSGVPIDRKVRVGRKVYTLRDFAHHSQMRASVTANQELSWTILALGQYLGTDLAWTNASGEKLRFKDLVRYEVQASVEQGACGGTHRLFGLQWVYNLHLRAGGKPVGVWKDLADEQARYQRLARKLQNPDGSFSTNFFRGPANAGDMQLHMNTTGHILEWLAYSLPETELRQEWMERAVNRLALMFFEIQNQPMEGGTLYHAAHGLRIYYERVFGSEGLGPQKPFLVLAPQTLARHDPESGR